MGTYRIIVTYRLWAEMMQTQLLHHSLSDSVSDNSGKLGTWSSLQRLQVGECPFLVTLV